MYEMMDPQAFRQRRGEMLRGAGSGGSMGTGVGCRPAPEAFEEVARDSDAQAKRI